MIPAKVQPGQLAMNCAATRVPSTAPTTKARIGPPNFSAVNAVITQQDRNGARQHHWSFGPMLPVKQKLTDGEIGAIIVYIRELQRENGIM